MLNKSHVVTPTGSERSLFILFVRETEEFVDTRTDNADRRIPVAIPIRSALQRFFFLLHHAAKIRPYPYYITGVFQFSVTDAIDFRTTANIYI